MCCKCGVKIFVRYCLRNVVFVFAAVLMMAAGLQKTLVETGSSQNVVVVRKGAQSEVMSAVERGSAAIVEMMPQVASMAPAAIQTMPATAATPKNRTTKISPNGEAEIGAGPLE